MPDLCIQDGQKILFIGDSITDCGRRDRAAPLGDGYVSLLRDLVTWGWPERRITWINKGLGGNRAVDLQDRWEDDVIAEGPDWLVVKIGINDLHCYVRGDGGAVSPSLFREVYDEILSRTAAKTEARPVLVTPFYMSSDGSGRSLRSKVLGLLPKYVSTVEAMADKFGTRLVNLQAMFERQLSYRPADTFGAEPVHPNRTGHLLIAQEILRVLCE